MNQHQKSIEIKLIHKWHDMTPFVPFIHQSAMRQLNHTSIIRSSSSISSSSSSSIRLFTFIYPFRVTNYSNLFQSEAHCGSQGVICPWQSGPTRIVLNCLYSLYLIIYMLFLNWLIIIINPLENFIWSFDSRNLPLSIVIGLPLVIFVYVLTNISYYTVMSLGELVTSSAPVAVVNMRMLYRRIYFD